MIIEHMNNPNIKSVKLYFRNTKLVPKKSFNIMYNYDKT